METTQSHPCERIYQLGANGKIYGEIKGVCRITGKESIGIPFEKWVKKTFTDWTFLKPGTIISNEAAFCFDEASDIVAKKAGKEKKQRFRTYSHVVSNNKWYCLTKADKEKIYNFIIKDAELICLTDTGQRHMLFKHRPGFWQLDEMYVKPDIPLFKKIHKLMSDMLCLDFSQTEIITGDFKQYRIMNAGLANWKKIEDQLKVYRGSEIFKLTSWMQFKQK